MPSSLRHGRSPWRSGLYFRSARSSNIGAPAAFRFGYFLVLLVGFVLWLAYGIAASNMALIVPNSVAAIVIAAMIVVALQYRQPAG